MKNFFGSEFISTISKVLQPFQVLSCARKQSVLGCDERLERLKAKGSMHQVLVTSYSN
jgi:hypothetical protein